MNGTASVDEFRVDIDLETAQRSATEARDRLLELRERYDLSRWEYARTVRIAPTERAHSHPVLTLNGFHNADEDAFLSTYLHEQIHWGLDLHREEETERAIEKLRDAYPDAHRGLPETGDDEYTTYLPPRRELAGDIRGGRVHRSRAGGGGGSPVARLLVDLPHHDG